MIKSKVILVLYLTIFLFGKTVYAQKVSNITFHQEQSTIIVSYDLDTKTPCKVSLFVSTNGGTTWQGPLTKITGDVGAKITSGSNGITWNVLEEFDELRGDKIMFQVRAIGDNIKTVIIGTQEWTTKNLNVSKYKNGDIIPEIKDPEKWKNMKIGAWCYYNNDPKNGAIYGKLYNWYAINDPRGLAPKGFYIPSEDDWLILRSYLGGFEISGGKMKETGIKHWKSPNKEATNESNFSALPGGSRNLFGDFEDIGNHAYWWSSNHKDISLAISNYSGKLDRCGILSGYGFYVRCVKD